MILRPENIVQKKQTLIIRSKQGKEKMIVARNGHHSFVGIVKGIMDDLKSGRELRPIIFTPPSTPTI